MRNFTFASVLVSTMQRHEYYYGDIEVVKEITEKARKEIIKPRIEKVNLTYFPSEDKMLDYIETVQALYKAVGESPTICRLDKKV